MTTWLLLNIPLATAFAGGVTALCVYVVRHADDQPPRAVPALAPDRLAGAEATAEQVAA